MRALHKAKSADLAFAGAKAVEFGGDPSQRSLLVAGNGSFDIERFDARRFVEAMFE